MNIGKKNLVDVTTGDLIESIDSEDSEDLDLTVEAELIDNADNEEEELIEFAKESRKKISARALWRAGFQGKHVASKRSIDDIRTENRKANKAARKTRAAQRKVAKGK